MNTLLERFNIQWFLAVNAPEHANIWLTRWAIVCADFLIYLVPLLLVYLWFWGGERERKSALFAVLVALIALGLAQVLGMLFPHPRPFMVGIGHTLIPHVADSSFPSDHATFFSAIGVSLWFMSQRFWAVLVLMMGLVVVWSRLYLGVHFPMDMMGAFVLSAMTSFVLLPIWKLFESWIYRMLVPLYSSIFALPIRKGWVRP